MHQRLMTFAFTIKKLEIKTGSIAKLHDGGWVKCKDHGVLDA